MQRLNNPYKAYSQTVKTISMNGRFSFLQTTPSPFLASQETAEGRQASFHHAWRYISLRVCEVEHKSESKVIHYYLNIWKNVRTKCDIFT